MRGDANETHQMELTLQWGARQASVVKANCSMIRGQEEPFGRPGQSVLGGVPQHRANAILVNITTKKFR